MLRAMAYAHTSGLPPQEAPSMIAEKHNLFLFFSCHLHAEGHDMTLKWHLQ